MDVPRLLYEQLRTGGIQKLHRMVVEGTQESLHLDFKTLKNNQAPMTREDQQTLAEAISGFGNSDGGVIVWGIDARKGAPDSVDCARSLQPISNLRLLLSNLHEYSAKQVSPAVDGVEHFIIADPAISDQGFAITLVPRVDGEPVMARASNQHRFYYRAGDSFLVMEHFMLADRFGRRPQPKLRLTHRWERKSGYTYAVLAIENIGRGIARDPALQFEERASEQIVAHPLDDRFAHHGDGRAFGLPERTRTTQRPGTGWRMFAGGPGHSIYPGTSLEVIRVLGWAMPQQIEGVDWRDQSFRYSLYCDGFSLVEAMYTFTAEEICRAANS